MIRCHSIIKGYRCHSLPSCLREFQIRAIRRIRSARCEMYFSKLVAAVHSLLGVGVLESAMETINQATRATDVTNLLKMNKSQYPTAYAPKGYVTHRLEHAHHKAAQYSTVSETGGNTQRAVFSLCRSSSNPPPLAPSFFLKGREKA